MKTLPTESAHVKEIGTIFITEHDGQPAAYITVRGEAKPYIFKGRFHNAATAVAEMNGLVDRIMVVKDYIEKKRRK